MIKTIVCTGDSHTWGQGPDGIFEYFESLSDIGGTGGAVCAGDLRPLPFKFPSYVNLVRNEINKITNSSAYDIDYRCFIDKKMTIDFNGGLARFFFKCQPKPALCLINNTLLYIPASQEKNAYKTYVLFLGKDDNVIEINTDDEVFLYRCEFYSGNYAVINSGIGSCTSEKFITEYYNDYVSAFKPSVIITEAHSINDWLNKIPLENVNKALKYITARHASEGCFSILLTVSPIAGETALPFNPIDYSLYIEESRRVAEQEKIILADANKAIGMDKFADNWHVNEEGNKIYADTIMKIF